MNFQINKKGKNTRKSLVLTILVFLTSSSLAYALTPMIRLATPPWLLTKKTLSLSFSLDLIQNATKNGYDKIYLANLHGQRYPDDHFVVATRVDKQWHLWEPDFRGNETRTALSKILEKSPVSTAATIYKPEEIAREGLRTSGRRMISQ